MEELKRLFAAHFGVAPEQVAPLQGELGGSGRVIVRLTAGAQRAIGISYPVREENAAFVAFSRHFRAHGLAVPEIYAEDLDHGVYLEEDLGDTTLFQYLSQHRTGETLAPDVVAAYRRVLDELPKFQVVAGRDLDYSFCYPRARFDRQSIAWDLNYFKYYFLRLAGVPFNEQALEDDFDALTQYLLSAPSEYFLYRDFQSRNVMLREGKPWFVDYQGGRRGALQYDVASLLFDAKADLPPAMREALLEHYLGSLARYVTVDREQFLGHYYAFVYVRILQAMGAYGFRGLYERKAHFLQSVPYAVKNLKWLAEHVELPVKLPALMAALGRIGASEKLRGIAATGEKLTVVVSSFSFHKEMPQDLSGNGGGFVFDARSLPNPGREAQYRALTGKDAAVIAYLEQQPAVEEFLGHASALVEASVATYRQRGFKHLMVSFGCTGGQHRSVYLAECLAKHLRTLDGVDVVLRHVEQERVGR